VPIDDFREFLTTWNMPTHELLVITFEPAADGTQHTWGAWIATQRDARWVPLEIYDPSGDLLEPLDEGWPRHLLADKQITVVGVGSIGSAACQALAAYGVRNFSLVDAGRLLERNFARHRSLRSEHGRLKVRAVTDLLRDRDGMVQVDARPIDADRQADQLRAIIRDSDIVLVCSDGTRSRRVAAHLAFRATTPVVLACVQGAGAYGEILRLVPGRTGCLLCNRAGLHHALEPEPFGFDLDYDLPGENGHPMTAVTGDLWLMGDLAAKAVVATLLKEAGETSQTLAGDMALIALRPEPDFPAPFDELTEAGQAWWGPTPPSRSECPTCGTRSS